MPEVLTERVRSPFSRALMESTGSAPAHSVPAPDVLTSGGVPLAPPEGAPLAPPVAMSSRPISAPTLGPLRPISGYEEDLVERNRATRNVSRLCNEILARCLVAPGEDPAAWREAVRALPVAARDRLLVDLRQLSFGDVVEMQTRCPKCDEGVEATMRLSALTIEAPSASTTIGVPLPSEGDAVARLPTVGDQEALLDGQWETSAERRTALLSRLLIRLGSREGPFSLEEVHAMPSCDRIAVEDALGAATPALDLSLGFACPACTHAWVAPLDLMSFFLPK